MLFLRATVIRDRCVVASGRAKAGPDAGPASAQVRLRRVLRSGPGSGELRTPSGVGVTKTAGRASRRRESAQVPRTLPARDDNANPVYIYARYAVTASAEDSLGSARALRSVHMNLNEIALHRESFD